MTVAIVGFLAWLLILVTGLRLAKAAKRGDEIATAAWRYLPNPAGDAQIIPFDVVRAVRRASHTEAEQTAIG